MARRIGWLQARIFSFPRPSVAQVELTHSGALITVRDVDVPADCREIGQKVWWRFNKHFQEHEIEARQS